uniref:Uncharacterized protein n=1 Tax=Lactuca sativa TaxID=4236 RepID=A0A9R1UKI0_LACSA|nr:hypothetical protein LSAT_V11C800428520 [Lactuca sativa]
MLSQIGTILDIKALKKNVVKLFENLDKYDDGANFFYDQHQGPVSATSSVVCGLTTFASASRDTRGQDIGELVPLILSLPASVLSFTSQDKLKTCVGAVALTDLVFWCLLLPFQSGDGFKLTLLIGCMHSLNTVFLLLDSALNSLQFTWHGLTYFVLWSSAYIIFQWVMHACCFTCLRGYYRWPYPFLEIATPWAPMWYFGIALVHLPGYGLYVWLVKVKASMLSKMFPQAFIVQRVVFVYNLLRIKITQLDDAKGVIPGISRRADLWLGTILMNKGARVNTKRRVGPVPDVDIGNVFFFLNGALFSGITFTNHGRGGTNKEIIE